MIKVNKELKNLKVYVPGKPIEEVKREYRLEKICKLASNENPFVPVFLKRSLLQELKCVNRYPEAGCFYLRNALAKKLKVKKSQLVFGNGSDEIIVLTLRAFVNRGDEVVVGFPTFLIYEIQAKIQGAKVVRVPLRNFRYDLKKMAKVVNRKTKIVFIANPDNPHGTYVTHKELKTFLSSIPDSVLVFIDEAYYEFVDRKDFPRTFQLLKERGNIILTRTFSKAYALAGLRIGYAVTEPAIADILNKIREPFNVNRFAQRLALDVLNNNDFVENVKKYVQKEKEYLYKELSKLGIEFVESVTNFILVDFKKDVSKLYDYLLRRGIIIRKLDGWGLKNFFRVTVGLHKENVYFVKELRNFLKRRA